jgi:hypothetical protein
MSDLESILTNALDTKVLITGLGYDTLAVSRLRLEWKMGQHRPCGNHEIRLSFLYLLIN